MLDYALPNKEPLSGFHGWSQASFFQDHYKGFFFKECFDAVASVIWESRSRSILIVWDYWMIWDWLLLTLWLCSSAWAAVKSRTRHKHHEANMVSSKVRQPNPRSLRSSTREKLNQALFFLPSCPGTLFFHTWPIIKSPQLSPRLFFFPRFDVPSMISL